MPTWLDFLDPINYVNADQYLGFWQQLFATLLLGFWGRLIAVVFLLLSFWFGVRRRNFILAAVCFLASATLAYGAAFLRAVGIL